MENKGHHEPSKLPYQLLKQVTNDFHEERFIGSGTFGKVYKGVSENGAQIAVKVLHNISGPDDKEFHKEFDNLRGLKHPNIVELVGFCNESEEELVVFEGKQVVAERLRMALCFEYVHNGSLQKRISDANMGFNWHTRYRIIKGICEGLMYLHQGLEYPVMHFDLKPDNILLDKNMIPKIADFGLAKLFGEENTKRTMNSVGTCGYWPPEYIKHQIISKEFDIFSLGVIIVKIMTGHEGYTCIADMTTCKFVKHVHENWRNKLCQKLSHTSLEVYCNQVKRCIELALDCLKSNRQERPTMQDIVSSLNETEPMISDQGLQIEQFYKEDDGEPDFSSKSSRNNTAINSGPASTSHGGASRSYHLAVDMPLSLLEEITDNFSQERVLGNSGYAVAYKGIYENGQVIVVKKFSSPRISDTRFARVIQCLMKVHHKNIVQFIGYCVDTQENRVLYHGRLRLANIQSRLLCFEYLPNGAVDQYISAISPGLDWHARYRIIKGTCEGLRYLHMERGLVHKDVRPGNILLDENMMPKINDFGMLVFSSGADERAKAGATKIRSIAYMAPEFIHRQVISFKSDIYSLGVLIIEIMTGEKVNLDTELVNEAWRKRLQKAVKGILVEGYCQQVKKCLEIASLCVQHDPRKRPFMDNIVNMLNETETSIQELALVRSELLDVQPLELCFLPFMPSLEPKKNKVMSSSSSCSLQLNNKGDDRVAFMLVANSPKRYLTKKPLCGVVPPRCAYTLTLTIMASNQKQPPSSSDSSDFFTLYSVMLGGYELLDVDKHHVIAEYDKFFKSKQTASGDELQEVMLKVICDQPAAESAGASSPEFPCCWVIRQPTQPKVKIITTPDAQQVSSIDVHPMEKWIMTTNHVGSLRVWNYQTMTMLNSFELAIYEPVHAAKFITREKWLIAGDENGCIHVYNYSKQEGVERFDAHDSNITTLDVHRTHPFVLSSSSDDDHMIKLWDWNKGWECTKKFQGHTDRVTQLKFNPKDASSFASASLDGTVKVWSICSDEPNNIMTLDGQVESLLCVDYFIRLDRPHLIAGSKHKTAQIWDLGIMEGCVHELEGPADRITTVNLHPELPILITGSLDGTVRIWDSTTYKLENIIGFNLGAVHAFGCINGSTRIVVGCHQGIAMVDISFPSLRDHTSDYKYERKKMAHKRRLRRLRSKDLAAKLRHSKRIAIAKATNQMSSRNLMDALEDALRSDGVLSD